MAGGSSTLLFNLLSPNIHMQILLTVLYIFPVTSWEKLIKHQHILCPVIISFILMTCVFDQQMIL